MKPLLFPCLLAAAIFLAPAQELPALKWTNRDQQSLMRGAWWNANPPLLPPVDAAAVLRPHAGTRRQCRLPRRGSHSGGLYGRQ
ncbi:MAG: hypothetical protein ACLRPT_03800 [Akkermansia muciniphila]